MKGKIFRTFFLTMLMVMAFGMTVCAAPAKQQAVQGVTPEGVVSIFQSTSGKTVTIRGYNGFCRTYTVPDYTVLPEEPSDIYTTESGMLCYNPQIRSSLSYSECVDERKAAYRDLAVAGLQEYLYSGMNNDYSGLIAMEVGGFMNQESAQYNIDFRKHLRQGDKIAYSEIFMDRGVSPMGAKIVAVSVDEHGEICDTIFVTAYCVDSSGQQFTMCGSLDMYLEEQEKIEQIMYTTDSQYREIYDAMQIAHQNGIVNLYSGIVSDYPEPYFSYARWMGIHEGKKKDEIIQQMIRGEITANDFCYSYSMDNIQLGWISFDL